MLCLTQLLSVASSKFEFLTTNSTILKVVFGTMVPQFLSIASSLSLVICILNIQSNKDSISMASTARRIPIYSSLYQPYLSHTIVAKNRHKFITKCVRE